MGFFADKCQNCQLNTKISSSFKTDSKFFYHKASYSQVPNKPAGHNKRVGWNFLQNSLNVQGESVLNKRVGWNFL